MSKPLTIYVRYSRLGGWSWNCEITESAWAVGISLNWWEKHEALRSARAFAARFKVAPKIVVED